ncbi:miniconductance mechanosensitive channel [Paucimonas lemoignei]|uniref:Mechanosensing system component YbdG n=1 Tax=Paucimonas lemoignei TaxID=29443 RepID=A0A4R3HUD1_PAULE|nr:mechanosensitive ion channel family protein [Paucimonas lemoignei]TCS36093.1 miniconductance mechanosensitive channel [Paucimonas lemoignei]
MTFPFLADLEPWAQATLGLLLLAVLAFSARLILQGLLTRVFTRLAVRLQTGWVGMLLNNRLPQRLAQVVPSLVVQVGIVAVPYLPQNAVTVIRNVAVALTVLHLLRVLYAVLDAVRDGYESTDNSQGGQRRSVKSFIQLGKLLLGLLGGIVIVAALIDRSPLILLSGLGAMSAVLMLVFKDTILSFTAGVQLTSNDLLRVGDWIEMPQVGADGSVIDIALHTVKVQNWDMTITSIPTWRLMSESYKNWRGMSQSGGRRIKRSLRLDVASVHFLDDSEIRRLARIELLRPYLEEKMLHLTQTNAGLRRKLGDQSAEPANLRRLTNIGTFRAYVGAYLKANANIRQDMTLMVRTLEPTSEGIPLELYCFTATTAWAIYEGIQGDIFDHLLAILPEFGLKLYQHPSGNDIRLGLWGGAQDLARA